MFGIESRRRKKDKRKIAMNCSSSVPSSRDSSPNAELARAFPDGKFNRSKSDDDSGGTSSRPSSRGSKTPSLNVDFWQDGSRRSAFSPYTRPSTVLTNLQRGNVKTQTTALIPDPSIHQLAAQGELPKEMVKNVDEVDGDGFTPLMWASWYGQLPTVKMLLEIGANCNIVGQQGENALILASCNGHFEILKLLIKHKMDVNNADQQGNTALTYAAFNNHADCAAELLKFGADITHENLLSESAYSVAITKGSKQVQAVMEKHLQSILTSF